MLRQIFKGGRGAAWVVLLVILLATLPVRPASKAVDLDGDGTTDGTVVLNVLQTWPPKIQNKVINNGSDERTFNWLNAGPGGFSSRVGANGELRWTWETAVTIYSYTGSVCRNDMCTFNRDGAPLGPAFKVPGRTVTQGAITTSTASLTSSLIQSFSPGVVIVECTSSVEQLANGNFGYTITCTNPTGDPVVIEIPPGPEGCCEEDDQLNCLVEIPLGGGDVAIASECVDYLEDEDNCGGCGNECDEGEECVDGYCEAECSDGWEYCYFSPYPESPEYDYYDCVRGGCECPYNEGTARNPCYDKGAAEGYCPDFDTDPYNCGSCGYICGDEYGPVECLDGACVPICYEPETLCQDDWYGDYYCADLDTDEDNCGSCGNTCGGEGGPEECVDGECELDCVDHGLAYCSGDSFDYCADTDSDPYNCGSCGNICPDCSEYLFPDCFGGECDCSEGSAFIEPGSQRTRQAPAATPKPTQRAAAPKAPESAIELPKCGVPAAPICDTPGQTIEIPPGGTYSECFASPFLAQEILGSFRGCGGSIPDGNPLCDGSLGSQGPFQQLVPLPGALPGTGFLNVVGIQMTDPSGNGLVEPGEKVCLKISLVNSGSADLTGVVGNLSSPPIDLTCGELGEDETECVPEGGDPASVTIYGNPESWPLLPGIPQTDIGDITCDSGPATPESKTNTAQFCVKFPATHPSDVARPFDLDFTGNGGFSQTVPFVLAVGGACDLSDGGFPNLISGMLSPKAKLLPDDQPVAFATTIYKRKQIIPLQLALYCGGAPVGTAQTEFPPRIVKLHGATNGEIDPSVVDLSFTPVPFNDLFRYIGTAKWRFDLRTNNLGPDRYVVTIRINDDKDYHFGFVLK